MAPSTGAARRSRGTIHALPSGSLRVRVYAGTDPLSRRRTHRTEVIPTGPRSRALAEKARTRLLTEIDQGKAPRTVATVDQLLDRYLEVLHVEETTREGYEGLIKNHIRPLLGHLSIGRINGEVLDSFYWLTEGLRPSTIEVFRAAISVAHQSADLPNPCEHPAVRRVLAGVRRHRGLTPPRRRTALRPADMHTVLAAMRPEGTSQTPATPPCC